MIKKMICKIFSAHGFLPLILAMSYNFLMYFICNVAAMHLPLHSLALPFDHQIPMISWTILIYFGCYIFWIVNYIMIYNRSREHAYRFFVADFFSRTVCMLFFLLYPTTLERPEITGTGIFDELMRFLYAADKPTNLFPSIHCLVSWFCFLGIRTDKRIPTWYKAASALFAFAVFASTLTTRQHVFLDIIGGVALAHISCLVAFRSSCWKLAAGFFDKAAAFLKLSESR